jgi:hypothetical protein
MKRYESIFSRPREKPTEPDYLKVKVIFQSPEEAENIASAYLEEKARDNERGQFYI